MVNKKVYFLYIHLFYFCLNAMVNKKVYFLYNNWRSSQNAVSDWPRTFHKYLITVRFEKQMILCARQCN